MGGRQVWRQGRLNGGVGRVSDAVEVRPNSDEALDGEVGDKGKKEKIKLKIIKNIF